MKQITAILIGAGGRGRFAYGVYAINRPHEIKFVAVAEPDAFRREQFKKEHNISDDMCFENAEQLLEKGNIADACLICHQDRDHYVAAMKAMELGYHILLEKPMTPDVKECIAIGEKAKETGKVLSVCHVLRYNPFFITLKEILDKKTIGRLISVQHNENVGFFHQAHSFVRGNWRDSRETSPMILAKTCHDMDILNYLIDSSCKTISSFGSLAYFKVENAPEGAPLRCVEGCPAENTCPYHAEKLYFGGPAEVFVPFVFNDTSKEGIAKELKEGPYGRCVFRCDNNVVDHQVVNMEYENGVTVAFTLCGFTMESSRTIKIMGTNGEIRAHMERNEIEILDFATGNKTLVKTPAALTGHGGGDFSIMNDFVKLVQSEGNRESVSSAARSVESHIMSFAAEYSRLNKKVVDIKEFIKEYKAE